MTTRTSQPPQKTKKSLGFGLEAVLGLNADDINKEQTEPEKIAHLPIGSIHPSPYQPRKEIAEEELQELADSIKQYGVMQPIIVRQKEDGSYELIAGERRLRASQLIGNTEIPALIKNVPDKVASAMALIENIQRENLNIMEEARGYDRLQRDFKLTHQQVADVVGKSRTAVTNTLRLMRLSADVMALLEKHNIEMGHARALLSLDDSQQITAAKLIVSNGLSVRQTEHLVKRLQGSAELSSKEATPSAHPIQQYLAEKVGKHIQFEQRANGEGRLTIQFDNLSNLKKSIACLKEVDFMAF